MKKRIICLLVLVCMVCGLMCACNKQKEITADEAISVVLESLGDKAQNAKNPHAHTATYKNEPCYNVYITISGEDWTYIVSAGGEIIAKAPGGHSH